MRNQSCNKIFSFIALLFAYQLCFSTVVSLPTGLFPDDENRDHVEVKNSGLMMANPGFFDPGFAPTKERSGALVDPGRKVDASGFTVKHAPDSDIVELYIPYSLELSSVQLVTPSGSLIKAWRNLSEKERLRLPEGLEDGLYFLRFVVDKEIVMKPFVVRNRA